MKVKYPRTLHLPNSLGVTSDDKIIQDLTPFLQRMLVISEKMDGENTSMTSNAFWARSLDSKNHPSRNYVKQLWGNIKHKIPEGFRICGENLYAKHSIWYQELPSYFLVHSIWIENDCLSWEDTKYICADLELVTVPIIGYGIYSNELELLKSVEFFIGQLNLELSEGLVIRYDESFSYDKFSTSVVKWVREKHIASNEHWMHSKIKANTLRGNNNG